MTTDLEWLIAFLGGLAAGVPITMWIALNVIAPRRDKRDELVRKPD